jgi:hypothetical protein
LVGDVTLGLQVVGQAWAVALRLYLGRGEVVVVGGPDLGDVGAQPAVGPRAVHADEHAIVEYDPCDGMRWEMGWDEMR